MESATDPVRRFAVNKAFSLKNNPLSGIALSGWAAMLWRYGGAIEWRKYWLRALFLSFMAIVNGIFALLDWIFFAHTIVKAKLHPSPVFILGHPRTGTTLMHNLLSKDDEQFYFCTTFQAGFPSGFAILNKISWLFAGFVDERRPMDNMKLGLSMPQEDELATNVLSGGKSQYMSIFLPRLERGCFRQFVNFEDATIYDFSCWRQSFMFLLKKLSAVNDGGSGKRRLLLKSPVHTGRVRLLLKLFPNAQFIYLHRDPYRVYQSAANMADKAYPYMYLHTPDNIHVQEFILSQFEQLHSLYVRDRKLIPKGNLIEIAFEDLANNQEETIARIYTHLKWPNVDRMRAAVREHQKTNKSYKKNNFSTLSKAEKKMVARRWKQAFDEFDYKIEQDDDRKEL
eukprot:jgi/Bigna1/140102/aug1.54_g14810